MLGRRPLAVISCRIASLLVHGHSVSRYSIEGRLLITLVLRRSPAKDMLCPSRLAFWDCGGTGFVVRPCSRGRGPLANLLAPKQQSCSADFVHVAGYGSLSRVASAWGELMSTDDGRR